MTNQISNPTDRKKIKDALQEISDSLTRTDAEKDLVKDIINEIADSYQLPKKYVNKMAKIYHQQSFAKTQQESEELETLYLSICETQS